MVIVVGKHAFRLDLGEGKSAAALCQAGSHQKKRALVAGRIGTDFGALLLSQSRFVRANSQRSNAFS